MRLNSQKEQLMSTVPQASHSSEVHVALVPEERLVGEGEGQTAIDVPGGVDAPYLQLLVVQWHGRMQPPHVTLRVQTTTP